MGVTEPSLTRRQALKTTASATGIAATGAATPHFDLTPIGLSRAESDLCKQNLVFISACYAGSLPGRWFGDGQTKDAEEAAQEASLDMLTTQYFETVEARKSSNASRILDQDNLLPGAENIAYEEGKIAALEAIDEGLTESEVVNEAQSAATEYFAIPQENLVQQWNESLLELDSYVSQIDDQGFNYEEFFRCDPNGDPSHSSVDVYEHVEDLAIQSDTVTLCDGTDVESYKIWQDWAFWTSNWNYDEIIHGIETHDENLETTDDDGSRTHSVYTQNSQTYLDYSQWTNAFNSIDSSLTNVHDNLSAWVSTVYADVQAGDVDTSDLLTPRMLSSRSVENDIPKAKADLVALNLDVELDREVTITTNMNGVTWTISGMFAATTSPANGFQVGTTYTPNYGADDPDAPEVGSVYMAFHTDDATGDYQDYLTGVDGGIVTITSEPWGGHLYQIETIDDETVYVPATDFTETDEGGEWEADLSNDLDNAITEVDSITLWIDGNEYLNERIENDFTVESIVDSETGDEYDDVSPEPPTEMHTDSNYTTKDEWDQLKQERQDTFDRMEELFKEVEDDTVTSTDDFWSWLAGYFPGLDAAERLKQLVIYGALGVGGLAGINFIKTLID